MASINKSFNFRHGVQVDDKDFTVRGSLVGIGTTVPTEKLDVRGNAVVSGFTSSVYLNVSGVSTFTGHVNSSTVGASGSITAVKFYGDGSNLTQLPTSQWIDVDVGLGYTSIYNNGGNVGVGTTDPRHSMQVGGDPTFGSTGVGIHSAGNIHATGVVTATTFVGEIDSASLDTNPSGITVTGVATAASFSGNIVGNITGNVTGNVNATSLDASTLSITGVSTLGVSTFTGNVSFGTSALFGDNDRILLGDDNDLDVHYDPATDQSIILSSKKISLMSAVGIEIEDESGKQLADFTKGGASRLFYNNTGTAADLKFTTSGVGVTVYNQLDVTNVNVTDNIQIYHSNNESIIKDTRAGVGATLAIGADKLILRNKDGNENYLEATDNGSVKIYNDFIPRLETSGVGVTVYNQLDVTNVNVSGVSTFSGNIDVDGLTELDDVQVAGASSITGAVTVGGNIRGDGKIGIGTEAQTDLQIQNAAESAIVLGRSHAITGTNASLRYGTSNAAFPYSTHTPESLDIINYGKGNVNFYLEAGVTGLGTGGFYWHRRSNFDQLMTLTYGGRLGLGVTVPNNDLHVVGTSTVTDNAWFGVNVNVASDINVGQNIIATGSVTASGLTVPFVEAELRGNVYKTSGISTFNNMKVNGLAEYETAIGIGTAAQPDWGVNVYDTVSLFKAIIVDPPTEIGGEASNPVFGGDGIGIGVTCLDDSGAINFANAGVATTRYMILPKVTTTQRNSLNKLTDGAIIYNTITNKFQGRANGAWVDLH